MDLLLIFEFFCLLNLGENYTLDKLLVFFRGKYEVFLFEDSKRMFETCLKFNIKVLKWFAEGFTLICRTFYDLFVCS